MSERLVETASSARRSGQVFLFTGHMIDAPGRVEPRFPPDKAPLADTAIRACLRRSAAAPGDLGICGGACGGDLLFAEACEDFGLALELRIPVAEAEFLPTSVTHADAYPARGLSWEQRYRRLAHRRDGRVRLLVQSVELGPCPPDRDVHERNNEWQLDAAFRHDPARVVVIALWDGRAGDGPGGTQHLLDLASARGANLEILDTAALWQLR